MERILHVDDRMFHRMQQSAATADLRQIDPAIAALEPTGIDALELGRATKIVVDLPADTKAPDGYFRLDD